MKKLLLVLILFSVVSINSNTSFGQQNSGNNGSRSNSAVSQFWNPNGVNQNITAANWAPTSAGPFTSAYQTSVEMVFNANSNITYVTGTIIGNITITNGAAVTWTSAGTINTNGSVRTVDVGTGSLTMSATQNISITPGTGLIKSGTGTWTMGANGNAYTGGYTLNAGLVIIGGTNELGSGGALTLNGGTLCSTSGTTRNLTGKYTGITIGGNIQFGDATNVPAFTGGLTFSNNMALGTGTTRTITIGNGGTYSMSGIISGTGSNLITANTSTGNIVLGGANNFTGTYTGNSGTVNMSVNSALGSVTGVTINNGATLKTSVTTLTDAINNTASVTEAGIGIIDLSGGSETFGSLASASSTASLVTGASGVAPGSITVGDASNTTYAGIISGTSGNTTILTKQGAGILTLTGANTFTGKISVNAGTLKLNKTGGTTISASDSVIVNGGTLQVSSDQTLSSLSMISGTLTVDAGVTLTITNAYVTGAGTINCLGTIKYSGPSVTFPGGTVAINNGTAGTITNFENNTSGTLTLGTSLNVSGTLTLTAGTLAVGANTLTLSGNSPVRTAGNIDASNAASTVDFTNTTSITLPASIFTGNVKNLTVTGTGGVILGAALPITGTLTVKNGAGLTAGSFGISGAGAIDVQSGSTIKTTNNTGLQGAVTLSGTKTYSSGANYDFGGTGTGTLTTTPTGNTVNNLTFSNVTSTTLGQQLTINGILTLTVPNLTMNSNNLTLNGTLAGSGTITGDQAAYITIGGTGSLGSSLSFTSGGRTLAGLTINRTTSGLVTLGSSLAIDGDLDQNAAGNLVLTNGVLDASGVTLSFLAGHTPITRTSGTLTTSTTTNLIFAPGISNTFGNPHVIPAGTFTTAPSINNLTINRGSQYLQISQDLTVNGTLTLTSGPFVIGANTLTIVNAIAGTPANLSTGSSSSIVVSGSGSGITLPSSVTSLTTLTLNNTNGLTAGANLAISGNLVLTSGTFSDGGFTITVGGNITGTGTYSGSGKVSLTNSGATISGANIGNIELNNAGGFSLSGNATINGTLTFTAGALTLGTNNLTIGSTGSISGFSSTKYIKTTGTGVLTFNSVSGSVLFPIGNGNYTPLTLDNTGGTTDNFSANVQNTIDHTPGSTNFASKQWNISEGTVGGSNAILTFQWNAADEGALMASELPYHSTTTIGHWTGSYYQRADGVISGSNPYTITSNLPFTSFSPFLVGSSGVLPVELASFVSSVNGRNVNLNWSTNSEINNSGFDVERKSSVENSTWTKMGTVTGNGTSTVSHSYTYTDRNVNSGNFAYRLKQIDNNGNYKYYDLSNEVIIALPTKFDLSQNYPNPFNPSTKINYDLPVDAKVSVRIVDMTGREVANLVNADQTAGSYTLNFNASSLSSGIYFYQINAIGSQSFTKTMRMVLVK